MNHLLCFVFHISVLCGCNILRRRKRDSELYFITHSLTQRKKVIVAKNSWHHQQHQNSIVNKQWTNIFPFHCTIARANLSHKFHFYELCKDYIMCLFCSISLFFSLFCIKKNCMRKENNNNWTHIKCVCVTYFGKKEKNSKCEACTNCFGRRCHCKHKHIQQNKTREEKKKKNKVEKSKKKHCTSKNERTKKNSRQIDMNALCSKKRAPNTRAHHVEMKWNKIFKYINNARIKKELLNEITCILMTGVQST